MEENDLFKMTISELQMILFDLGYEEPYDITSKTMLIDYIIRYSEEEEGEE